jgi:glycosyltransferase involved in cell wall biosynthesis
MEALASGTPVVARRVGSLPDSLEEGTTGLFADDVESMAAAMHAVVDLEPRECRRSARERFSADRITDAYLDVYRRIAAGGHPEARWREATASPGGVTPGAVTRR